MDSNYSITEDLSVTPCNYTDDGYCLRNEDDYCKDGECRCPHLIAEIVVIATVVNCETTVTACHDCKEHLDKPKTDCR